MTPEAVDYLGKAREDLSDARRKEISDYGTGPSRTVASADAEALIVSADTFVRWVGALIG